MTTDNVEKKNLATLQARLATIDQSHLSTDPIRADYTMQYKGGLIGRDFKSLAQLMVFAVYDIVPEQILDCWRRLGTLMSLLWYPMIDDVDAYCVSLESKWGRTTFS